MNLRYEDKSKLVKKVFNKVYDKYDLMNDIMSLGTHRMWKKNLVSWINPKKNNKIIAVASGTGDITYIRMIESGSGYTSLPTATIDGSRFIGLENATNTKRDALFPVQERANQNTIILESGARILQETAADNLTDLSRPRTTDFSRIELEQGGRLANESSFSVLNVTGATVIPFGADIGRATSLSII